MHCGGAGIRDARLIDPEWLRGHDIVILLVGGNDLASGESVGEVAAGLNALAEWCLQLQGVRRVIIPMTWPRQDTRFNRHARGLAERLQARYFRHPQIVFWTWDPAPIMADGGWGPSYPEWLQEGPPVFDGGYCMDYQPCEDGGRRLCCY